MPACSRSEEHTSELQSHHDLVCRLLLDPATTEIYTLSLHDALPILIDSARRALGPGQPGELALSGGQVAQGYFADPGTTLARFPLIDGETWYLTGDLAYRDDAGVFQIGRAHV